MNSVELFQLRYRGGADFDGDLGNLDGMTPSINHADIIKGIDYAINSGAEVINLSIGEYKYSNSYKKVADKAEKAGVVVVAAAGNDSTNNKIFPASVDNVIGVGGMEGKSVNKKWKESNYGSWVNIVAPATGFISTNTGENGYYTKKIHTKEHRMQRRLFLLR